MYTPVDTMIARNMVCIYWTADYTVTNCIFLCRCVHMEQLRAMTVHNVIRARQATAV